MKYVVMDENTFERIANLIDYHNRHKTAAAARFLDEDLKICAGLLDDFSACSYEEQFFSYSIINDINETKQRARE